MEIGISQDVLIDIGLNAAGFLIGGMILMLIGSFRKSRRVTVGVSSGTTAMLQPSVESTSQERPHRGPKADFNGEYINFNNFDWHGERGSSAPTRQSSSSVRNREEVIKMAKQMLADKRDENDVKANLPVTDGELAYARYLEKLTNTGRNR